MTYMESIQPVQELSSTFEIDTTCLDFALCENTNSPLALRAKNLPRQERRSDKARRGQAEAC